MTQYREILRLTAMGLSQRSILNSVGCSQKTVVKVQRRARELKLSWPLADSMTDAVLEETLFPKAPKVSPTRQMPDFDYIRRELLRNGVNKKLLWTEYLENCRQNGCEPLMYSQFCYYIQQDEQRRRATMHIARKPGELPSLLDSERIVMDRPLSCELCVCSVFFRPQNSMRTLP